MKLRNVILSLTVVALLVTVGCTQSTLSAEADSGANLESAECSAAKAECSAAKKAECSEAKKAECSEAKKAECSEKKKAECPMSGSSDT